MIGDYNTRITSQGVNRPTLMEVGEGGEYQGRPI